MKWVLAWVKASDYAIKSREPYGHAINSGSYYICKSLCNTVPKFTLWHGSTRMGDFDTAEKAKEAAKKC